MKTTLLALLPLLAACMPARAGETREDVGGARFAIQEASATVSGLPRPSVNVVASAPEGRRVVQDLLDLEVPGPDGRPVTGWAVLARHGDDLLAGKLKVGTVGPGGFPALAPGWRLVLVRVTMKPSLYERLRYGAKERVSYRVVLRYEDDAGRERRSRERRREMRAFGRKLPAMAPSGWNSR